MGRAIFAVAFLLIIAGIGLLAASNPVFRTVTGGSGFSGGAFTGGAFTGGFPGGGSGFFGNSTAETVISQCRSTADNNSSEFETCLSDNGVSFGSGTGGFGRGAAGVGGSGSLDLAVGGIVLAVLGALLVLVGIFQMPTSTKSKVSRYGHM